MHIPIIRLVCNFFVTCTQYLFLIIYKLLIFDYHIFIVLYFIIIIIITYDLQIIMIVRTRCRQ